MRRTGLVLAGGRSRRFGEDKALLLEPFGSMRLIDRALSILRPLVDDLVVVRRDAISGVPADVAIIDDPATGPAAALSAAFDRAPAGRWFVIPCDMPSLTSDLYRCLDVLLRGEPMACYEVAGILHPLVSVWQPPAADLLRSLIASAKVHEKHHESLASLVAQCAGLRVKSRAEDESLFRNINQRTDYDEWAKGLGQGGAAAREGPGLS